MIGPLLFGGGRGVTWDARVTSGTPLSFSMRIRKIYLSEVIVGSLLGLEGGVESLILLVGSSQLPPIYPLDVNMGDMKYGIPLSMNVGV